MLSILLQSTFLNLEREKKINFCCFFKSQKKKNILPVFLKGNSSIVDEMAFVTSRTWLQILFSVFQKSDYENIGEDKDEKRKGRRKHYCPYFFICQTQLSIKCSFWQKPSI